MYKLHAEDREKQRRMGYLEPMKHRFLEAITDHIFLVKGKNKGRFPYSHSVLILDKESALLDTGCGIEALTKLMKKYEVNYVINSHTHPDHSAGNWVLKGARFFVPDEGFETSGDLVALSKRFVSGELAHKWREFIRDTMNFKNCKPTDRYNSETVFKFGKATLEPIYTPGHTNDHYCFFEPKERILFSFDYDLTSFPWYGHRESSISEFKESINNLKLLSPKTVVSSHKGVITEGIDAEFDRYHRILGKRNEKILALLGGGKTIDQLVRYAPIYREFPYAEPILRYWESEMIKKHLRELEISGRVEKHGKVHVKSPLRR